jgi:hypothetical protein
MDIFHFIVEMSNAWAWPFATTLIALQFKGEIVKLLLRLRRFKYKDTELEFTEGLKELVEESQKEGKSIAPPDPKNIELRKEYDTLMRIAELSPRAAIIETFRRVELAAYDALSENSFNKELKNLMPFNKVLDILRNNSDILDDHTYQQLKRLRDLRNKAVHSEEFSLSTMPVEAYIDIALTIASQINQRSTNG